MNFTYKSVTTLLTGSNNQFEFYEFGIFTNFLNQIAFNSMILKIVLISQTIRENLDLQFQNWLLDLMKKYARIKTNNQSWNL